jgi:sugar-specific transcriptional regulator TrmB
VVLLTLLSLFLKLYKKFFKAITIKVSQMENNRKGQSDEPIQTFMSLGLPFLQAKLYLTLVKLGSSGGEVRKISRDSNIARQDVYRILPQLEKRGLAVKIISSPSIYSATPLDNGFSMLLNQKTEEYIELQKKAKLMFNNFTINAEMEPNEKTPQFIITSEKKLYFKRVEKEVKQAQTGINIICSKEGVKIIASLAVEEFEKMMDKGVKIRVLTNDVEEGAISRSLLRLKSNPNFELEFSPVPSPSAC